METEAEIPHLHLALTREHHIGRLQVSVDDATVVQRCNSLRKEVDELPHIFLRKRAPFCTHVLDHFAHITNVKEKKKKKKHSELIEGRGKSGQRAVCKGKRNVGSYSRDGRKYLNTQQK